MGKKGLLKKIERETKRVVNNAPVVVDAVVQGKSVNKALDAANHPETVAEAPVVLAPEQPSETQLLLQKLAEQQKALEDQKKETERYKEMLRNIDEVAPTILVSPVVQPQTETPSEAVVSTPKPN